MNIRASLLYKPFTTAVYTFSTGKTGLITSHVKAKRIAFKMGTQARRLRS